MKYVYVCTYIYILYLLCHIIIDQLNYPIKALHHRLQFGGGASIYLCGPVESIGHPTNATSQRVIEESLCLLIVRINRSR